MISAIRYTFWLILIIGAVLAITALSSFIVNVPGFSINGEEVKTTSQKLLALTYSLVIMSISIFIIYISRRSFIARNAKALSICHSLENMPINNIFAQIIIISSVFIASLVNIILLNEKDDVLTSVLILPVVFVAGVIGSLFVLGLQAINPFCPKSLLRAFSLITMAFFGLGSLLGVLSLFTTEITDPAQTVMPMCSLGFSAGAVIVLKKWGEFTPMTSDVSV